MPSRNGIMFSAALFSLALVCHAAIGANSDDDRTATHAIAVDANGDNNASLSDFDGDGTVGFSDFVSFAGVFGASEGDEKYKANYDLNGDGVIGFSDFVIFAQNFGKEAPSPFVAIPDANLRAAIETALGKDSGAPITRADMATLDSLEASDADISDLSGLEFAVNLTYLTYLTLNDNDITDISSLSKFTMLERLWLSNNGIEDISALAKLTNLTELWLWNNRIEDISALSKLTNLTRLSLGSNNITDISALSGLINLRMLIIQINRISDISPLVANTGLGSGDTVNLIGNLLSSISCNTLIPTLQSRGIKIEYDSSPKKVVRFLYVYPKDRPFRSEYSEGISKAILDVQSWYRDQLGGLTFHLSDTTPEWCQMSGDSDYYSRGNAWKKVMEGVQHCAPVAWDSDSVWVLYVDVDEACDEPHELGAGGGGIVMMPGWDLRGLVSSGEYYECDKGPYPGPLGRWFGGLAHELAHAVGVPHPPGCDAGLPTCDSPALMWLGYTSYPDTYLRFDEKEILIRSPFITGEATPTDGPDATEGSLGVHGVVLDPSGAPGEGIRLSLVADTFWNWGETGQDGTFRIGVPEEASGPFVVSVHGGKAASCNWLGYHGPSGLTSRREDATQVAVGATDAAGTGR